MEKIVINNNVLKFMYIGICEPKAIYMNFPIIKKKKKRPDAGDIHRIAFSCAVELNSNQKDSKSIIIMCSDLISV